MAVSYKKLWKLLIDRDMKKKDLCEAAGISHGILAADTDDSDSGRTHGCGNCCDCCFHFFLLTCLFYNSSAPAEQQTVTIILSSYIHNRKITLTTVIFFCKCVISLVYIQDFP